MRIRRPEVVPLIQPSVRISDRGLSFFLPGNRGECLTKKYQGTCFVFIAALLYSLGGLCIKVIPWGGIAINGGRTAIALVVIGIYLLVTRHPIRLNRWIFLGALSVFGCNLLFSLANKMTTAANTIVLQFTAPIFVILFSCLFFKRKIGKLDLWTCGLVFGGVIFFFLDSLEMGGGLGNLVALLSGVSYAGVFLMNDMPDSDAICSVFWGDALSAVVGLPFALQEPPLAGIALVSLIVLGAFQVGVAYVFLCEGLKTTSPVTASLISGIEPVLNPILVAVFYHETVGPLALIGAAVVIISVVGYNVLKGKETSKTI